MKFRVTMNTPGVVEHAIEDTVSAHEYEAEDWGSSDEFDREELEEELANVCRKWFRHGEYLVVELDTKAKTCVVVPNE